MSPNRQPEPALVRTLALGLPRGHAIEEHRHDWAQLVYGTEGVMTVSAAGDTWVVPPRLALWVPADQTHAIRTAGRVRMRTLYFAPGGRRSHRRGVHVIQVSDLLRELVLEVVRRGMLLAEQAQDRRLAAVLLDQLAESRAAPLRVPEPIDPRARALARRVRANPADPRPITELARGSGASVRTLERTFVRETGLTFGRWRQRTRLVRALELLAAGQSVTTTALDVGYDSTSAFIAMFRRALGVSPGSYFREALGDEPSHGSGS